MRILEKRHTIILIIILIHFGGLIGFLYYSINTSICSTIKITQNKNIEYTIETPVGRHEILYGNKHDTLIISERPIKEIFYKNHNGNKLSLKLEELKPNKDYNIDNILSFRIEISPIKNKTINVILFFINSQNVLKYYLVFWILVLIAFLGIKFKFNITLKKLKFYIYHRWLCKTGILNKNSIKPLKLNQLQWVLLLSLSIVLIVTLFLNLDKYQFAQYAEKRRVLVSQEMQLSGNYIVPTMFGEPYYNKPPLFFWLTAPFTNKENVEQVTRSLSVFNLVIFGTVIFLLLRKKRGKHHALSISFFTIASWHVLSYLSFTVNLDVLFSVFVILLFYINYKIPETSKPVNYFILSYFICALAFLTKGFPALWFQFVSIMISLIIHKKPKLIFSAKHFIGIFVFVISLGIYFLLYSKKAMSLDYLRQLIAESVNVYDYNVLTKLKHFILFPAKNMFQYAPLALLIPILFMRKYITGIVRNKEMSYLLLVLLVGVSVFWTSPFYKPYYTLMFVPILFDLLLSMINIFSNDKLKGVLNYLYISAAFIITISIIYNNLKYLLFIVPFVLIILLRKHFVYFLLIFSAVLIVWKSFGDMGYYGENENYITPTKSDCKRIALKYSDYNIKILSKQTSINHNVAFYLNYFTGNITEYNSENYNMETLYCADLEEISEDFCVIDSISQMQWSSTKNDCGLKYIYLLKYNSN